jgi:hypothetical protein
MPTGYTAGIIDGSIKDFKEYAILCTRAFGATIHMRDESLSTKIETRKPSNYHLDVIAGLEKEMEKNEKLSDEDLIAELKKSEEEDIERYESYIEKAKRTREKLLVFKSEAQNWNPPTDEHVRYKEFMLEQLQSTIEGDGDSRYYEKVLAECKKTLLAGFDPKLERERRRLNYKESLEYHLKSYREELERCDSSNQWLEEIYRSLK